MTITLIPSATRKLIHVRGIVQGVGFRPFVYSLAQSLSLSGHVFNTSAGVTIEVEGDGDTVDLFLKRLGENPPHLAELVGISASEIDPCGSTAFSILQSEDP